MALVVVVGATDLARQRGSRRPDRTAVAKSAGHSQGSASRPRPRFSSLPVALSSDRAIAAPQRRTISPGSRWRLHQSEGAGRAADAAALGPTDVARVRTALRVAVVSVDAVVELQRKYRLSYHAELPRAEYRHCRREHLTDAFRHPHTTQRQLGSERSSVLPRAALPRWGLPTRQLHAADRRLQLHLGTSRWEPRRERDTGNRRIWQPRRRDTGQPVRRPAFLRRRPSFGNLRRHVRRRLL